MTPHSWAKPVYSECLWKCLSQPCVAPYLERIQIIPGQPPGHHLPQDDPKWVNISRLAVVMLRDHLHCSHYSQHVLTVSEFDQAQSACRNHARLPALWKHGVGQDCSCLDLAWNRSSMKNDIKTDSTVFGYVTSGVSQSCQQIHLAGIVIDCWFIRIFQFYDSCCYQ